MSKGKCLLCGKKKGKRACMVKDGAVLCPLCCAEIRNELCEGCSHYSTAVRYEKERHKKHFTTLLDQKLDDACDSALDLIERGNVAEGETRLMELNRR